MKAMLHYARAASRLLTWPVAATHNGAATLADTDAASPASTSTRDVPVSNHRIAIQRGRGLVACGLIACCLAVLSTACPSSRREPARTREGAEPASSRTADSRSGRETYDVSEVPGRIHRVEPGDTLWSLAETYYGNNRHWRKILTANRNRIKEPGDLEVGQKLIIP